MCQHLYIYVQYNQFKGREDNSANARLFETIVKTNWMMFALAVPQKVKNKLRRGGGAHSALPQSTGVFGHPSYRWVEHKLQLYQT